MEDGEKKAGKQIEQSLFHIMLLLFFFNFSAIRWIYVVLVGGRVASLISKPSKLVQIV